jgi:PAS domain-containing protein
MTREIQRKARAEQALLDANLRANAERLRAEQELRMAQQRQQAIIESLPIVLYLEPLEANPRRPAFVSGNFEAVTGLRFDDVTRQPNLWADGSTRRIATGAGGDQPPRAERRLFDRVSLAMRRRRVQALPRSGRAAARPGRQAGRIRRHADGRDRPQAAGDAARPRPQDGRDRPADRRHRARFQQSARRRAGRARHDRAPGDARRGPAEDRRHDAARGRAGFGAGRACSPLRGGRSWSRRASISSSWRTRCATCSPTRSAASCSSTGSRTTKSGACMPTRRSSSSR